MFFCLLIISEIFKILIIHLPTGSLLHFTIVIFTAVRNRWWINTGSIDTDSIDRYFQFDFSWCYRSIGQKTFLFLFSNSIDVRCPLIHRYTLNWKYQSIGQTYNKFKGLFHFFNIMHRLKKLSNWFQ
jgi:hypothetical protein